MYLKVEGWKEPQEVEIDTQPDACPICHRGIQPISTRLSFITKSGLDIELELVFRCPRQDCGRFFIARYARSPYDSYGSKVSLSRCEPWSLRDFQFDNRIREISPDFAAIYNEAQKGEQMALLLACGPAYRKALEFLVKDYLIIHHPAEVETIKSMLLGSCIKKYVANEKIRAVAERAAWLGNDETHYLRKWGTKDLQDLKALITLTVQWILMEELTRAVLDEMPGD